MKVHFSYLESWKVFRKCKAESDAKTCEGGSMYPCIYYFSLEEEWAGVPEPVIEGV